MFKIKVNRYLIPLGLCLAVISCKAPEIKLATSTTVLPEAFISSKDTATLATIQWHNFFKDKNLVDLIDVALQNNQELAITLQEIEIAKNDIRVRKGALLPSIGICVGSGVEKVGRYTSQGAGDASTEITPGHEFPEALQDYKLAAYAHWEVDIWKKLRNSKKAAISRYLATVEGKNFVITNLVAEIASSYYELLAYDNQLEIVKQNIAIKRMLWKLLKSKKKQHVLLN